MENLENLEPVSGSEPTTEAPVTDIPDEPVPAETVSFTEECSVTESAQPQPIDDLQHDIPPVEPVKPQDTPPAAPKGKVFKRIIAGVLIIGCIASSCFLSGMVLNNYWSQQNQKLQEQLSALQSKTDRLQAEIQSSPNTNSGNNNTSNTNNGNSSTGNNSNISNNTGTTGTMTPAQVYAQNVGAVVYITTNTGSGSGFIVTENGYVVTNYHVIEGATKVEITLSNSEHYAAKVVGYDATHDVAVLKVDATGLPHVVLGSSDALAVGDQITVIGNPLGELTYTQTVGYISGKDRGISTDNIITNMLQTDASINSGNSGGPMFNMNGEVVGIITAKYSGTSSSGASIEGIGFAIPIDDVSKKIYDLIEFGYISGAYLGVTVRDMDKSVSQSFGIPMGAYVVTVEKTNCAYAAGVREKDVIIGLGEYTIGSLNELSSALQNFNPGDTTTIKVWRAGTELTLTITLDDRPH